MYGRARSYALFTFLALLLAATTLHGEGQTAEQYRVEAVFIFHFAQLVDWPQDAEAGTDNSLFFCTIGNDPFAGALEEIVAGKQVALRTIHVRHLQMAQDMRSCQLVFFSKAESKHTPEWLAALRNTPVLTVGETADFLDVGGIIRFLLENDKIRFEINLDAAQAARLKIGSRLLMLAERVQGESHAK
jgi:hypothetical protein